MRRRVRLAAVTVAVMALGLVAVGAAQAAGAQTFTEIDKNVVEVNADSNPCTGAAGTLTQKYNAVFHGTINKTGSWFTGTLTGTFTFVPADSSQPSYTGRFTVWFGDENNLRNDVEHSTTNIHHAIGSDGSILQFHENVQAAMNANGAVTVSFDHLQCG